MHLTGSSYDAIKIAIAVCQNGWRRAVASQLADVVDGEIWDQLTSKRRRGLCHRLARAAEEIEGTSAALGEAAGLATLHALRWLAQSRLVQKLGQIFAERMVPKLAEAETAAVARALRITGILLCAEDGTLNSCPCLRDLASDHTKEYVRARLEEGLRDLA